MTPEQEALREKVARNIERAVQMQDFGHWGDDGGFICTVEQAKRLAACCDDAAADAIAVVLKEALDGIGKVKDGWLNGATVKSMKAGFVEAVFRDFDEAILSLIPQEDGK